jgi:hypothetical protein
MGWLLRVWARATLSSEDYPMSITLELAPETEEALRIVASRRNESPEAAAERLLKLLLTLPPTTVRPLPRVVENGVFHQDRWDAVMESIRKGSANAPTLPDEALRREAMYDDHD